MPKIDLKKELKNLYSPSVKNIEMVDVPPMNYLMIDGEGDPNTSQDFQEAVEALFGLSYTLKFMVKKGSQGIDYGVMPLEGLWWAEDMIRFTEDKESWKWTAMIMQPEYVTSDLVNQAMEQLKKKKNPSVLGKVRFQKFDEGKAAQIMYIGPYSEEGPTIERIHSFIKENGFVPAGKHHEIYLSDPRRAAPEKLKTVIRQPFRKA